MAFLYQIGTSYDTYNAKIKHYFDETVFLDNFIQRENYNYRGLFVDLL